LTVLYAGTIFLGACLLFQVQPLISRYILPWFGGSPAVWTTCLLFFQTALFAGYAYAHVSEHYFGPKVRTAVHLALIVAALLTLPITPSDGWKPLDSAYPTARILTLLAVCVGLPYFVLASTGPLVQAWFSRTFPGQSPYRLYSLSNFGSLLALLSYPFVVEPALDGAAQGLWWTAGFVLFCLLCGTACWLTARLGSAAAATADAATDAAASSLASPTWKRRLLWLVLPAFASILLMATTNHVCQDMPPVPFLWVVPLSLYLLSFIIAFDHERWYRRLPYGLAALIAIYLTAGMYNARGWGGGWLGYVHQWIWGSTPNAWIPSFRYEVDIVCQFVGLFLLCMLCHGELVRLRPQPRYLTGFYLMIAAGGALGGLSVSLVAPQIFHTYAEWKLGLATGFVLAATVAFVLAGSAGRGLFGWREPRRLRLSLPGALRIGGLLVACMALVEIIQLLRNDALSRAPILAQTRNFYGVLTVTHERAETPAISYRQLFNGGTRHGVQFVNLPAREFALAYYSDKTGVGQTIDYYRHESARTGNPLRVGVVGLGVGTLAAYVYLPRHTIRFYEINPEVLRVAETYFTYLADARERLAVVDVVIGDARLSLERELKQTPQAYDLLVLDAFSSDSIPIHLLTQEAFEVYLPHLAAGGAVAVHISNRYLDLAPVVYGLAKHFGLDTVRISSDDQQNGGWPAEWIILSRNQKLLETLRAAGGTRAPEARAPLPLWTDQRHNLLEALR
jgi:hypothetical protein